MTLPAVAQTDSVSKNVQLKEVVVAGDMAKREVDHIDCIPTPKQRKHAHSGFELIRNMMLAGVNVDIENGVRYGNAVYQRWEGFCERNNFVTSKGNPACRIL